MTKFPGFTDSETLTSIPDSFFRKLLYEIDETGELKVTLYALWRFEHMQGRVHYLRRRDFAAEPELLSGLGEAGLDSALEKAVQRGSLLRASPPRSGQGGQKGAEVYYFLNSPRGRAAAEACRKGQWHPAASPSAPPPERPNVYRLYEENIGPLTPLLADALRDAEQTYPPEWVAEAIEIAVKRNKRNWNYVEAILRRWKEEGHAKKQDRRDAQEDGRRYVEGEYADFIEH